MFCCQVSKGLVQMEISKKARKDVVGLRQRGVQVRKVETSVVEELNKVQYVIFRQDFHPLISHHMATTM